MGWLGVWGCMNEPNSKGRGLPLAKQRVLPRGAARMEMLCGDHPAPPNPAPQPTDASHRVSEHFLSFSDHKLINPKVKTTKTSKRVPNKMICIGKRHPSSQNRPPEGGSCTGGRAFCAGTS